MSKKMTKFFNKLENLFNDLIKSTPEFMFIDLIEKMNKNERKNK